MRQDERVDDTHETQRSANHGRWPRASRHRGVYDDPVPQVPASSCRAGTPRYSSLRGTRRAHWPSGSAAEGIRHARGGATIPVPVAQGIGGCGGCARRRATLLPGARPAGLSTCGPLSIPYGTRVPGIWAWAGSGPPRVTLHSQRAPAPCVSSASRPSRTRRNERPPIPRHAASAAAPHGPRRRKSSK